MKSEINTEPMAFESNELIEVPVVINGVEYTLREADGKAACKYRNEMLKQTELTEKPGDGGKTVKLGDMANVEPLLVSLCLFDADKVPVPLKRVLSWKPSVITALFERAKEISELDQDDDLDTLLKQREELNEQIRKLRQEDPAKNEPSETPFG